MNKYIPADKLIAEMERLKKRAEHYEEISLTDCERSHWSGESSVLELLTQFIASLQQEQPSLPSNLDEAANNYGIDIRLGYPRVVDETDKYIYNAFKAGAEWMAGQGVRAHCVESANPVSESPDVKLHIITLLYEENEYTPYVRGGDNIDIIIRKK